jgi:hypothetical protein
MTKTPSESLLTKQQTILSALGAILGILGSLFICWHSNEARLVGFTLFLYSNMFLLWFHITMRNWWCIGMQSVFLITSLIGIYSNMGG